MTVANKIPWIEYLETAGVTVFAYDWDMLLESEIEATVDGVDVFNFTYTDTEVTFDVAPVGDLVFYRRTPVHQPEDYAFARGFKANKTELTIDRAYMIAQEIESGLTLQSDLTIERTIADVTVGSTAGTDALITLWDTDKAGMFAGEVTDNAPANNSATSKPDQYVWLEYGDIIATLCGSLGSVDKGQLLNVGAIQMCNQNSNAISQSSAFAAAMPFNDTKVVSFTAALIRENAPVATAYMHQIHSDAVELFAVYLDSGGFIKIMARNLADTVILDATITNNGGSFTNSQLHFIAGAIDLSGGRELFINSVDRSEDAAYVTWNTYTDELIPLEASNGDERTYSYGIETLTGNEVYGSDNGTGAVGGIDALGYITFDDSCSLITEAVWDGIYVSDPQKWAGWYATQPQVFFGPTFWKNTGKTAPSSYAENSMELAYDEVTSAYMLDSSLMAQTDDALINKGISDG